MKRALIGSVCLALALAGCSEAKDEDAERAAEPTPTATASTSAAPTQTPPPTPTGDAPDPKTPAIDYDTEQDSGVTVKDSAAADGLSKAPSDFKEFIAAELTRLQDEAGSDCSNKPQIRVSKLQPAGWAAGGVFTPECGGYSVLWVKTGGTWAQVWGGQELVDCVTLTRYKFPASVAGDSCLGQSGSSFTYTG